jgi:hypothetical protein
LTESVPAVVLSVDYFGHDCVVTAELPAGTGFPATSVTCRLLGGDQVIPGALVGISVSGAALAYPVGPPTQNTPAGWVPTGDALAVEPQLS